MNIINYSSEIAYWDTELSLKGVYPNAIINRSTKDLMIKEYPPFFEKYRLLASSSQDIELKVLDVGSGPLSMLAYGHYRKLYKLECVDPLGDIYLNLLKKHGISIEYSISSCPGEQLSSAYPKNTYNLVWIHNALDHSQNPAKVMVEMAKVLKPGGYLCVAGWANEATAEGFAGLHQNNLFLQNNQMFLSTKSLLEPKPIDLIDSLVVVESSITNETREWFQISYQKIL